MEKEGVVFCLFCCGVVDSAGHRVILTLRDAYGAVHAIETSLRVLHQAGVHVALVDNMFRIASVVLESPRHLRFWGSSLHPADCGCCFIDHSVARGHFGVLIRNCVRRFKLHMNNFGPK